MTTPAQWLLFFGFHPATAAAAPHDTLAHLRARYVFPCFTDSCSHGGVSRGEGFVGVSPSSGATSRGQMNSPIVPAAKGTGKPQHCVFIDDAAMANLCFGLIGTGERFCLAKKVPPYTHCGLPAHAKGSRKKNKAKVVANTYYVPGGTIHQRPTAKVDPMILRTNVPGKFLIRLETEKLTTSKWKDLIIDARMDVEDSGGEDEDSKNKKDEDGEMEIDDGSIPSGFDEGEYDETSAIFEVDWGSSLSQMGESADWAPTMYPITQPSTF